MKTIGYTRKTINDLDCSLQVKKLQQFHVDKIIEESPGLTETLTKTSLLEKTLDTMQPGDILVVTQLNRLGRSTRQLAQFIQQLEEKKLNLISLKENINTTNEQGILYFSFMKHLAEMECDLIKERTLIGLKEARKKGKIGGRPKTDAKVVKKIRRLYFEKNETIPYISNKCHVSIGTCYKYINLPKEEIEKLG